MRPFKFILPPFDGAGGLTREQQRAVNCEQAIFSGVPGTGKTTVAIWRIKKKKDDILMTYTRLLSAAIGHIAKGNNGIWGVHQWYYNHCGNASLNDDINSNNVLNRLRQNNVRLGKVIIDEGQDIDRAFYIAINHIAERVSIGADDAQKLYEVDISKQSLQNIFPLNIDNLLTRNFRNLFKIYNFARHFVPDNPQTSDKNMLERLQQTAPGGTVEVHIQNSEDGINKILKRIIDNNSAGNIGILLSTRDNVDQYAEILDNNNISHSAYHSNIDWKIKRATERNLESTLVTTFKSAKGLEFDTVIMPEFEHAERGDKNQYYVGATRAKEKLYILCRSMPDVLENIDDSTYKLISSVQATDEEDMPF